MERVQGLRGSALGLGREDVRAMLDQPLSTVGSPALEPDTAVEPLGPCVLHAPADLSVWRDVHLALAATGETVRPEEMAAFAFTRRDKGGALRAALAGEVVQEALHISHLWVDTPWRGRGLGAELMGLAEARGRAAGVRRCHLETRSEAARRFYARRGFQVCGEMKNFLGTQSLYFMEMPLG